MIEVTLMGLLIVGAFTYMNFSDQIDKLFTREHK